MNQIELKNASDFYMNESIASMKKVMSGKVKRSLVEDIKSRQDLINQLEIEKNSPNTSLSDFTTMSKLQDICTSQINYLSGNVDISTSPKSPTIEEVLSQSFDPNLNF